MQYFYINQNSTLPYLRMELVNDGKYEYYKTVKFNNAIQNTSSVTFSMEDENGVLKISDKPCDIILSSGKDCEDHYIIEYKWKPRDTKKKGKYIGKFKIDFNGDIYEDGVTYPNGTLIMPIYEDITIFIK